MTGIAPYKAVVSHGFVLDGNGNKMSKSMGNTIDPLKMCDQFGADILRLWVASVEYSSDVRISIEIMKQSAEAYRKIRNTFRFLLGNLNDFNPEVDAIAYKDMPEIDQYMEVKLQEVIRSVDKAYEEYAFDEVFRILLSYFSNELSSFYLDFTKDILYIEAFNHPSRRSIQTVFYDHLYALVRLLNPIIPFTCEEVYRFMPFCHEESVYLERLPEATNFANGMDLLRRYQSFGALRDDVLKAIEVARAQKIIGKSLAAKITLYPTEAVRAMLDTLQVNLKQVFIVSEFIIAKDAPQTADYASGTILVEAREGIICSRCWQVVDVVNEDGLCPRCEDIVKKIKET
ncbi:MAG: class I tRNA ligase family protein, partial [Bacilli bacterium]